MVRVEGLPVSNFILQSIGPANQSELFVCALLLLLLLEKSIRINVPQTVIGFA